MKLTQKHLRVLFVVFFMLGILIIYETDIQGRLYIGYGLMILGLILLAPWIKVNKESK